MSKPKRDTAEIIPPAAYPQPVDKESAALLVRRLRTKSTAEEAERVVAEKSEDLREVIRRYVGALDASASDLGAVFAIAHEVRGFAATAGLSATGRIADGLYRYLDRVRKAGAQPDRALVSLHVSAIVRAAHAEDEASRMSEVVASELSELVSRKLKDVDK